jgi:hypothetical protein
MASVLLTVLATHEGSKQWPIEISRLPNVTIVSTEDYARRVAVSSTLRGNVASSEVLALAKENLAAIRDVGRISGYAIVKSSGLTSSWWHRNISLQPDCKMDDAFKEEYTSCLHTIMNISSSSSDSICDLVAYLRGDRRRNIILIEGTDAALLAAMWEEINRKTTDIFITSSLRPREGYSIRRLRISLGKRCCALSPIAWSNLLFCLPMVISAGLPPILMLQYYYRDNPVCQLLEIVRDATNPIFKDGAIQLLPFVSIIKKLREVEEETIKAIHGRCAKDSTSGQNRVLVDIASTSWDQFRTYYYMDHSVILSADGIKKRVLSYLAGLIQLANIYQGKVEKGYYDSNIRIADAPLLCDILSVLIGMGSTTQSISLPTTYSDEVAGVRTINRVYPWFGVANN